MRRRKLVAAKCEAAIKNIGPLHWRPIFSGDFVGGDFRSGVFDIRQIQTFFELRYITPVKRLTSSLTNHINSAIEYSNVEYQS